MFSCPADPTRPVSREMVKRLWKRSERLAEIPHVDGRGWHSFRRKLATKMEIPLEDLCYLGGWKDHDTILKCYQQPREQLMRSGLERHAAARAAGE